MTKIRKIDALLNKDEKILWEGKPKFVPYFIRKFIIYSVLLFVVLICLLILSVLIPLNYLTNYNSLILLFFEDFLKLFFLPFYLILLCWAVFFIIVDYNNKLFIITDKKFIVQKGIIKPDFDLLDYNQNTQFFVKTGLYNRIFKANTLFVFGKEDFLDFYGISNSYDLRKFLNKNPLDEKLGSSLLKTGYPYGKMTLKDVRLTTAVVHLFFGFIFCLGVFWQFRDNDFSYSLCLFPATICAYVFLIMSPLILIGGFGALLRNRLMIKLGLFSDAILSFITLLTFGDPRAFFFYTFLGISLFSSLLVVYIIVKSNLPEKRFVGRLFRV